jgi:hypothetical protein
LSIDGPGLYQDDTGHDVRAEFRELIGEGRSAEDAAETMLGGWKDVLGDEDVFCAFYLALADTQWHLGRPLPSIREMALRLIDTGRDLRRWEYNDKFHRRRKGILAQLRARLTSDPPQPRSVRNPAAFITDLEVGDVVHYTAEAGEMYWIGIVGSDTMNGQRFAIARLLDWDGSDPDKQLPPEVRAFPGVGSFALMPYRRADMPAKRSRRFPGAWNVPPELRQDTMIGCSLLSWGGNLDPQLRRRLPNT